MQGDPGRGGGSGAAWAQVIDAEIIQQVTEWLLPGLACPCCGTVTFAEPPPGAHAGSVSYGPVLNAAAVVLTAYGNVPPERAAQLMAMPLSAATAPTWADEVFGTHKVRVSVAEVIFGRRDV